MATSKLATIVAVISVFGVVFLTILGICFYIQAVTLFPDLYFNTEDPSIEDIEFEYSKNAKKCLLAAVGYGITFVIAKAFTS